MPNLIESRPTEGVALIQLNRPEALNALDLATRRELAETIYQIQSDALVRAIVITGDEKAFAAGADLVELSTRTPLDDAFRTSRVAWEALEACKVPVIAAVNGYAFGGGCELALHCDIVIAGETAKFALPEVKVGIMPGAGGTQRLLRTAGKFRTMRYALTGDTISAQVALTLGLASEVVPDADVISHAIQIASRIAKLPPLAVAAIKEVILAGQDASLDSALILERKAFQLLFASADSREGISAFIEKRKAQFSGQ